MNSQDDNLTVSQENFIFGSLSRMLGIVSVRQRDDVTIIEGVNVGKFLSDVEKFTNTTRVVKHMFANTRSVSALEFYSFFLMDVEYLVRNLANEKKTMLGKRTYVKILEELREKTWLGNINRNLPGILNMEHAKEIVFSLKQHQVDSLEYYSKIIPRYGLRGLMLAAAPGAGKTVMSGTMALCYEAENVIIVAPKFTVYDAWENMVKNQIKTEQTYWVAASGKPLPDPDKNRWYIFHYERLDEAIELGKRIKDRKCMLILDESHNLNDIGSLRTQRWVELCRLMKRSISVSLSGTPMKAMGSEAIPLLLAIDPLASDKVITAFKKIWGTKADKATDILVNRLGIVMYKVAKTEVMSDKPVEMTIKVKVPNGDRFTLDAIREDMDRYIKERFEYYKKNYKYYRENYDMCMKKFELNGLFKVPNKEDYSTYKMYIDEFIEYGYDRYTSAPKANFCNSFEKKYIIPILSPTDKKLFHDAKSVVKYVDLKIRGECLGKILGKSRMECYLAVLEHFDMASIIDNVEKKTLVFTSYVEVVKQAEAKAIKLGYKPLTVFADTNHMLPQMVKRFGEDENINPMIATFQSLSTGVHLTMANGIIMLNAPFRVHEKEQTVARAHRIGQDRTVYVYNVFLDTGDKANISTRSEEIMEWSKEQVNALMGFENDIDIGLESFEDAYTDEYFDAVADISTEDEEFPEDVRYVPFDDDEDNRIRTEIALESMKYRDVEFYNIKPIMQEAMGHVKVTPKLIKDIRSYLASYVNKNEEHISFFGGNLTGVNNIVFSSVDRNAFCIDILDIDEYDIKRKVRALPNIGDHWVRGTDGLNLALIYLMHLIVNSNLPDGLKRQGFVDCFILLQIKFLSSILYGYFKYPVSEDLALAVYNSLTKKFYIKKYGTWYSILENRALDEYSENSIHWRVLKDFEADQNIQDMITDVQTRQKSMILNIYEVTVRLNKAGKGIGSNSLLGEHNGKIEVKDIERNFDSYLNYIISVVPENNAFIKRELVEIVSGSITTMPEKLLYDLLNVISKKSFEGDKKINDQIREVVIFAFDYLRENKRDVKDLSNIGRLLTSLKALFTASKTNSSTVLKLREYFDKLVKDNIKSKNPATISGVRTGIVLYIILRTLTKGHFE